MHSECLSERADRPAACEWAESPTEVTFFGATIKADPARFCAWAIYVLVCGCATGRAVSRLHSHPAPVSRARCRRRGRADRLNPAGASPPDCCRRWVRRGHVVSRQAVGDGGWVAEFVDDRADAGVADEPSGSRRLSGCCLPYRGVTGRDRWRTRPTRRRTSAPWRRRTFAVTVGIDVKGAPVGQIVQGLPWLIPPEGSRETAAAIALVQSDGTVPHAVLAEDASDARVAGRTLLTTIS